MSNNSKYMRLTAEKYTYQVLYLLQLTCHVWNGIIRRLLLTEVLIAMLVFHSGGNVYLKAVTAKLE